MSVPAEHDWRALFAENPLPLLVLDRETLEVFSANRAAEKLYGSSARLVGQDARELWVADEREGIAQLLVEAASAHHTSGPWRHERASGEVLAVEIRVSAVDFQKQPSLLVLVTDITARLERERTITEGALLDPLTGVSNSAKFLDHLEVAVARAEADPGYRFAVLYLDLDRFGDVHERFGRLATDRTLAAVGSRLSQVVGRSDTLARAGGDEFAIITDLDAGEYRPVLLAEAITEALREPFTIGSVAVAVSASIGIAVSEPETSGADAIMRNADAAMHRAKRRGRDRFEVFDAAMQREAALQARTSVDLQHAIEHAELVLHYQPIIDIPKGDIRSCEGLIRWNHPVDGLLQPGSFIGIAEESGMIVPLGEWVIHEAARQIRLWRDSGMKDLSIAVNVSGRQFKDGDVVAALKDALREAGIDGRHLTVELTESVVMDDPDRAVEIMAEIKDLGVGLSMDDFGTGYSSLAYLRKFAFDALKIDRSFVKDVDTDAGDAALVAAVIALAHSFRFRAVAEGIESPAQLSYLRMLRCDFAQGFLFSRPLPAADLEALMRRDLPWKGML